MSEFTKYTVDQDKRFSSMLDRIKEAMLDLRPAFQSIANDFYKGQVAIFELGSPGPYPDLSPRYKVRKNADYGFLYPILEAKGDLKEAASRQGGTGNITEVGAMGVTFGVDSAAVPHAGYHNSDDARSKMPLRKFMFIGPECPQFVLPEQEGRIDRWLGILNDYAVQRLAQEMK